MILSLFDYSGTWSQPYRDAGIPVMQVDTEMSNAGPYRQRMDVRDLAELLPPWEVEGILAAPPCRCFCKPGARLWKQWDAEGDTEDALSVVDATLAIVKHYQPTWWVIENPPGRLANKKGTGLRQGRLGPPRFSFHPWQFAALADNPDDDRRTKLTYLWGNFTLPTPAPLPPHPYPAHLPPGRRDPVSRVWSSQYRKRATTPTGFARAFAAANPATAH